MIWMSGSTPITIATAFARSSIVDAGALRMKRSPGAAFSNAYCTSATDSSSVMRNRVMWGFVMVIGLPLRTCSTNSGITEPREYMTLP